MNHLLKLFFSRPGSIVAALLALFSTDAAAQFQLLHPTNAVWRYQTDLGAQQAAGADWVNTSFDDSSWPQGRGLFGNDFGYPYAMNTTGAGLANGLPVANYFRTHFTWSGSTAGVLLTGTNYVDDGSILYLNGVEIARFNMGPEANAGTPEASAPLANPGGFPNVTNGGEPVLVRLEINLDALTNGNANPLVQGDNVIAVQAHQQGSGSSDRVFGLALYAGTCAHPCFSTTSPIQPTNRVILEGRSTTFIAIEGCAVPVPTIQWYRDTGAGEELIPGATGASYTLTNALPSDTGVYYAKATSSCGTATSRQASLIVMGESMPPRLLSARLGANNLEIIVTADEPLCPDDSCAGNATYSWNYEIFVEGDEGAQLGIFSVAVNANVLTFTLNNATPWLLDTRYVIRLQRFGAGTIGDLYGNLLNGGDPFSSVTIPAAASAISVKWSGSNLYTFDEPPYSTEFSTFTWVGDNSSASDAASLDTLVQALDASLIIQRLPEATGNPPGTSGTARYASETKNLITRPAGVIGNVILAHLRNDTGSTQYVLTVTYTLTNRNPSTSEEIAGHLVYYSFSGTPNTWFPIYGLYTNGASGSKIGVVAPASTPWPAGADMYLSFVDDNAVGAEGIYEIDNFQADAHSDPPPDTNGPALTRAFGPNNTTIVLTFSERMYASAGTTAPYSVSGATVIGASLNSAGNEAWLTTTPRSAGNATVTITGLRDASARANLIEPNPTTFNLTTVQKVVDWNVSWEYNTNNLDSAPDWTTTGGAGWRTGNGLFGTETSAATTNAFPTPIATAIPPPNTNNQFLTSYFRKRVNLPPLSAGQSYALGYYVDDGAIFYLDGGELGRFNMPAGAATYLTLSSPALPEGVLRVLPFNASEGDHTLAVELHQVGNNNSDTVFGAQVIIVPTVTPSLSIAHLGANAVVNWNADSSWSLVGSTNVAGPYAPVAPTTRNSLIRPAATPSAQFYKLNYVPQP